MNLTYAREKKKKPEKPDRGELTSGAAAKEFM